MKRNTFNKALKHLKSTELDEKIQRLNEAPTNSMSGVYSLNRAGFRLSRELDPPRIFYPDSEGNWPEGIPGTPGEKTYTRPAGYWDSGPGSVPAVDWDYVADFSHSDTSTDGFIDPTSGTVLSNLPPDSRHFILGPLVDGYAYVHGYDDYTNIGYIQKDTRQFILLGRIQGYWRKGSAGNAGAGRNPSRQWGGTEDGFTSYNENFTLEMAQWMRDQYVNGTYIKNVSYYYTGGQPQRDNPDPDAPPGSKGGIVGGAGSGGGPGDTGPFGSGSSGGGPNIGTPQEDPRKGGPEDAGFPWGDIFGKGKKKKFDTGEEGEEQGNPFLEALKNLGKSLVNTLERLMLPKEVFDNIVTNYSRQNIEAALSVAGKIIGAESASKTMLAYNKFMANPNGPGSSPSDPFLINSTLSRSDLNKFAPLAKYAKTEIESLRKFASSDEAKEYIPDTKAMRAHGLAGKTKLQAEIEILEDRISSRSQQIIDTSYGLKNSLHYGLKTKVDIETGEIKLTKGYQFRSGGSVQTFESTPLGQVMTKLGIPADTGSTGFAPVGFAAAALGMPNAKLHGGIYNAPPMYYELNLGVISEGYDSSGNLLTESRKRIIREVKKPYTPPEYPKQKLKKYKPNFAGKYSPQNTPDVTACKESDEGVRAKNAAGQMWRTKDKYWSRYQSTERMNVIHDQVGHGDQYWEMIVNENQNKKKIRDREVQEHLNILSHERAMLKENPNFKSPFRENLKEQETVDAPNEPLFNKVSNKLKSAIDYPDKPSREGYPNVPPPEMVNGWHPEYGKDKGYYNKLDPQSAASMPHTGNSEIDAKVQKAKRLKEIIKKKA